jgi:hypothetical protein
VNNGVFIAFIWFVKPICHVDPSNLFMETNFLEGFRVLQYVHKIYKSMYKSNYVAHVYIYVHIFV